MNSADFELEKNNWENTCEEVQEYMEEMETRVEELEEEAAESDRAVNRLGESNNKMCDRINELETALKNILRWLDRGELVLMKDEHGQAIEKLRVLTK